MQAMTSSWYAHQYRAANVLAEQECIRQWCQGILGAMQDQRRRLDRSEVTPGIVFPAGFEMTRFGPGRGWRVEEGMRRLGIGAYPSSIEEDRLKP